MAIIKINVADFGSVSQPGDRVVFYAPVFRTSSDGRRVVSTAPRPVYLTDGVATVEQVDAGPLMVEFACRNLVNSGPFRVVVPEANGTYDLHTLLADSYDLEPEVLSQVKSILARAEAIEEQMAGLLDGSREAADRLGTAAELERWLDQATVLGEQAKVSADSAGQSASAADASARAAASTAEQVESGVSAAAASAQAAAGSAEQAGSSATDAGDSATAAAGSATSAGQSATDAQGWAAKAEQSAGDAAGSATSAKADADRAERVAESTSWDGDVLTVNGKSSPSLRGPQGEVGPKGADGVMTFDDLTDEQRESLKGADGAKSWDELEGKPAEFTPAAHVHRIADVEGLQGALDAAATAEHTHTISEVNGLQSALEGKAAASHSHTWGEVTGKPTTFPPSTHAHSWADITSKPTEFTPSAHTHVSADVTDAVSNGSQSGAAGKLVAWDSGGHIDIQNPIRGTNPATRAFVQNQVAGTLSTSEAETTTAITASKLARRTSTKHLQVDVDPVAANDLARKAYVDGVVPKLLVVDALPASPAADTFYFVKE